MGEAMSSFFFSQLDMPLCWSFQGFVSFQTQRNILCNLAGFIEKNATTGIMDSFNVLGESQVSKIINTKIIEQDSITSFMISWHFIQLLFFQLQPICCATKSSLQAQLCTKPTNPPRKKVLRKRHVERTPPKSAPILDNQNHVTSSKH